MMKLIKKFNKYFRDLILDDVDKEHDGPLPYHKGFGPFNKSFKDKKEALRNKREYEQEQQSGGF